MKALRFYILFLLLGGAFSCHKKDYPKQEEVVNTAVYYTRLTIDNKPVVLEAGVNGYYMYSSYQLDSSFVYNYIADLRKADCADCTNRLKIQINDYKVSLADAPSKIDSSLKVSNYPILAGSPKPSYLVSFQAQANNAASYNWDFGDGNTVQGANQMRKFTSPGKYNICLAATSAAGYFNSICNKIKIDASGKSYWANITANASSGTTINFTSSVKGGKAPYQYLWNFGEEGKTSTQENPTCVYKVSGSKSVVLRVVDAFGDTSYTSYNAKTFTDNSSYTVNYSILNVLDEPAVPVLSQITITWADENGVVYTSNSELQPGDSSFEIISVSDNERNENGQPTKKIKAKFKCKLYNGTRFITVNDAEVVICVAYN